MGLFRKTSLMCLWTLLLGHLCACEVGRLDSSPAPWQLVASVSPNTLVADGEAIAQIALHVANQAGVGVPQAMVHVQAQGGGVTLVQPPPTDADGAAVAQVRCLTPGVALLSASLDDGRSLKLSSEIGPVFCLAADGGANPNGSLQAVHLLQLNAEHAEAAADITAPTQLTLVVQDADGRPLAGQLVQLESDRAGDVLLPATAITDAAGRVTISLTASALGTATLTAHVGAASTQTAIHFIAGATDLAQSTLVARSGPVIADGVSTQLFDLTLRDGAGNGVPYAAVSLVSDRVGDLFLPDARLTDVYGHYTVQLTGTVAGARTVTASTHRGTLTAVAELMTGPVDAGCSSLTLVPATGIADGISPSDVSVRLADAQNNAIGLETVTVHSTVASDVFGASSGTVDGSGHWSTTVTGATGGDRILTAVAQNVTLVAPWRLQAGPVSTSDSTLTVVPPSLVVDGSTPATVTLELKDAFGNLIAGEAVELEVSGSNNTIAPATGVTDSMGRWQTTVLSTVAEAKALTATTATASFNGTVTFLVGPPSAAQSFVAFSPNALLADNTAQSTITVALNDAFNNPISNQNLTLSASGSNTLAATSGTTSASGVWTTQIKGTQAGTTVVTVMGAGVPLMGNVTFVAGSPNASLSVLSISPNTAVADGQSAITLSALMKDRYGNLVAGVPVTFSASGSMTTVSPTSATTNSAGYASSLVTTPQVQNQTLTVMAGGLSNSGVVNFTLGPPNAAHSTFVASPNQNLAINGNGVANLTLIVRDAQDRLIAGAPVFFSQPNPQGYLTPIRATTSALGMASSSMTSAVAGNLVAAARVGGALMRATATFLPQAPVCTTNVILGGRPLVLPAYRPIQVATEDMNHDGIMDLVVLSTSNPGVNIFIGNGNGTFAPKVTKSTVGNPVSMTLVDLNHDNLPDTIVANSTNTIYTFMGNSSTVANNGVAYAASGNIVGLCSGDLDKDGYNDIVAISRQSPAGFSVLLGKGNGSFQTPVFYNSSGAPRHCVVADLDGDTLADLAITNSSNATVDLWRGTGSGAFSSWKSISVGSAASNPNVTANTNDIRAADLNHDGLVDLVVSNTTNMAVQGGVYSGKYGLYADVGRMASVSILISASGGNFLPQLNLNTDKYPAGLQLADMDGDGNTDIVVACGLQDTLVSYYGGDTVPVRNNVNVFPGNGDGTFKSFTRIPVGVSATSVAVADYDNDGNLDVAYNGSTSNGAGILFGKNGNFPFHPRATNGRFIREWVISEDFNLDGLKDVIGGGGHAAPQVALAQDDGNFILSNTTMDGGWSAVTGDFNGDGIPDFAVMSLDFSRVNAGLGIGDGNFVSKKINWDSNTYAAGVTRGIGSGDLNGDGLDDVVVLVDFLSRAYIFTATGDAQVFNVRSLDLPPSQSTCMQSIIADFSNTGVRDLALVCKNLLLYKNDGHGSLGTPSVIVQGGSASSLWQGSGIDVNADGFIDIVTVTGTELNVFLNDQLGYLVPLAPKTLPVSANSVVGADFDGDGFVDIVIPSNPGFVLMSGTGSGSFGAPKAYMGGDTRQLIVSDLDRDGRPDLVAAQDESGLTIYLSQGCMP